MATRLPVALILVAVLLSSGSAGASGQATAAGASARAYAIRIVVPGQTGTDQASASAPPGPTIAFAGSFAYPSDGTVATTGSLTASASTDVAADATASASSEVSTVSLFNGDITVGTVTAKAHGATSGRAARGDLSGTAISSLTVLGQPVTATPNGRVALGDWGYAITLEQSVVRSSSGGAANYHGFVTALDVHLTATHGNLPAGSEIFVGYAEALVQAAVTPPAPPIPPAGGPKATAKRQTAPEKKPGSALPAGVNPIPPGLAPKLTAGGYVFPVYGPSSFSDTYGAFRGDVSGGWHHGDDIFAPLGAPILACADGTVFSVGWNDVGGNRLWLRDAAGNEFYYAHLSAFSPLARNNTHVRAGEVVGFVGNTGDAAGTPYHLHFEVHPVRFLYLGYDGAVNPTGYLTAWKHLQDVRFAAVAGWVPAVAAASLAPKAGAILLQVSDISQASGLDPASLRRAFLAPSPRSGEGATAPTGGFRVG